MLLGIVASEWYYSRGSQSFEMESHCCFRAGEEGTVENARKVELTVARASFTTCGRFH